ncbi:10277_t:CDS:2 [Cetraspora pellucida]|uniref:10277_t:CDS:1 n=1 Tax=Cetraspora pellucida TaxID=1433469 RepID=A0ACA9KMI5_9GLOM|nr:10277_t:CDS:2 [Cetraspora pellucida]
MHAYITATPYDAADNDSSPDSQYMVTFKHNNHGKTRINHTIDYEDLFMMEGHDYITDYVTDSEYEENAKSIYKQNEKKLQEFDPIKNVNELHSSYATLLHEMQQGTISPLTLFHLFFTDYYFQMIINNTNSYEKLNQDLIQEAINDQNNNNRITRAQLKQKKTALKSSSKNKRIAYVTKNFNLPISRFSLGNHLVEW